MVSSIRKRLTSLSIVAAIFNFKYVEFLDNARKKLLERVCNMRRFFRKCVMMRQDLTKLIFHTYM